MPLFFRCFLLLKVMCAVMHLHDVGVIHKDIKVSEEARIQRVVPLFLCVFGLLLFHCCTSYFEVLVLSSTSKHFLCVSPSFLLLYFLMCLIASSYVRVARYVKGLVCGHGLDFGCERMWRPKTTRGRAASACTWKCRNFVYICLYFQST